MIYVEKVIIVEGTSDRRKIESIIRGTGGNCLYKWYNWFVENG